MSSLDILPKKATSSSRFGEMQIDIRESKENADNLVAKTAKSGAENSSIVVVSEDKCFGDPSPT